ncbi:MAG: amino acid ABC transporter permease [OCS116 cluster bacterium]|uniref:Amino acid ABC transporter permease n=1 Tax=OCS116 cluster bacterium TaxID=2030921 RepID=A0A2A4Z109_9PROT|nr:amino acid ABC transporter permease [OCS116 cluster bacterium]
MSVSDVSEKAPSSLGAMWRDKKTRAIIMQIVAVIAVLLFFGWLVNNTVSNIENLGIKVGFDFLWNTASYDINQTLIDYTANDTHFRAGLVGLLNTLLVAVCGVILATILGFSAGVARLSNNFVLSRLMQVYVEAVRNVPVLLQILLWYGIILHSFPRVKAAEPIIEGVIATNRGLFLPQPLPQDGFGWVWIAFFAGIIGSFFFRRYAKKALDSTGKQLPVLWASLGLIIGLPIIVYFLMGQPLGVSMPELKGFNYKGGFAIKPEFLALWLALSIYTGAFIAEIVRAGILSVSHGQSEAAHALGIKPSLTMRLVVVPQALRVIIPPLISQYLNLTKNSSLAIAIGYMDIVATLGGISLNQSGRALEIMLIILSVYLFLSLSISGVMNIYNERVKLVER